MAAHWGSHSKNQSRKCEHSVLVGHILVQWRLLICTVPSHQIVLIRTSASGTHQERGVLLIQFGGSHSSEWWKLVQYAAVCFTAPSVIQQELRAIALYKGKMMTP